MITKRPFGLTSAGNKVTLFTLKSEGGAVAEIMDYGGTIVSLTVPNRSNEMVDVVLGYDTIEGYETGEKYIGAIIGRYSNRIAKGQFTLNGSDFQLAKNDGENHLHGGMEGFDKKLWQAEILGDILELSYFSEDGEEGYPGNLLATVTYTFNAQNGLLIEYQADCDKDTIVSLTNHTYFNLSGYQSGTIDKQWMQIFSESFTPADEYSIPHGSIFPVEGTPLDFRRPKPIGAHIDDDFETLRFSGGYDQNWVLRHMDDKPILAAYAYSLQTGITLSVSTTMPGIHFYTGNFLDGAGIGKKNTQIKNRTGFCLETQYFPNSPNISQFPSPILRKGKAYRQQTNFQFGILSE